jgi:hypothetical protein
MKNTALGLYDVKEFEFESLSINFDTKIKQNAELHYCRGRFIYTKSSIFGNSSSFEAFNSSSPKSVLTLHSTTFFKSSLWQSIDHRGAHIGQWSPSSFEDG